MARGTQHRKRRPKPDAGVTPESGKQKKKQQHEYWEDQLFFSRLRNHAKWVFVLLAILFGGGFILFGVGSGTGGIGDIFPQLVSGSSEPSVSSLQKRVDEQPQNAEAWRELSARLQQDEERLEEAIAALTRYTELKPKDDSGFQELGGLYLRLADQHALVYTAAEMRSEAFAASGPFIPPASSPLANVFQDPVSETVTSQLAVELNDARSQWLEAQLAAVDVYKRIVVLRPNDANIQLRLGQVAERANDVTTAIAAYKKFLELSPNDSQAPLAKQALEQLTATPAVTVNDG